MGVFVGFRKSNSGTQTDRNDLRPTDDGELGELTRLSIETNEDASLFEVAIRNEELRIDYESLMQRFTDFAQLRTEFEQVTRRFVHVIDDLEESKKERETIESNFFLSESIVSDLRQRVGELEPQLNGLLSEKSSLMAFVEKQRDEIANVEGTLTLERDEHHVTREALKLSQAELFQTRANLNALEDEMSTARRELDRLSIALANKEVEFDKMASAFRSSDEHNRLLKNLLDEASSQNARLTRNLSELEPFVERLKDQIATLQTAVEDERAAKEQALIERIEGLELLRAELRTSNSKLEGSQQRADTNEKMLVAARTNYREKLEELRGVERRIIDITMQLANMTRRAETAESEALASQGRLTSLEAAQRQFDSRAEELSKAIAERDQSLLLARDQMAFETGRLEEIQRQARADKARFEAELLELTKLLEQERINRTVLEGALLTNRRRQIASGEGLPADVVTLATREMENEDSLIDGEPPVMDLALNGGAIVLEFSQTAKLVESSAVENDVVAPVDAVLDERIEPRSAV